MTKSAISFFLIKATTIASLGGILFGYDLGAVSSALPQIADAFALSEREQELVVSFIYVGGGFGAAVGGTVADMAGRRKAILITDVFFLIGAAILFWSTSLATILLGRFVVGFAVALSAIADVSYLYEISPSNWRGSFVSVNEACISFGFLVAYIVGYGITLSDPVNGWRSTFGVSSFGAMLQFIGMTMMPESPVWLREQGRVTEADSVQMMINDGKGRPNSNTRWNAVDGLVPTGQDTIVTSYASIRERKPTSAKREIFSSVPTPSLSSEEAKITGSIMLSLKRNFSTNLVKQHYRQISIAIFLAVAQQMCGQTNILNFAPKICTEVGLSSTTSMLGVSVLVGTLKFFTTCIVLWRIEYLGRRYLLLGGICTMAISNLMLASALYRDGDSSESIGTVRAYIALLGMLGVTVGYAASFAPLTWLIISELFHTKVRGRALGAATIITYLSAALVSVTFLSVQARWGSAVPFLAYFLVTVLSVAFAYLAIPDTGGKDPDQINSEISSYKWWRWRDGEVSLFVGGGGQASMGTEFVSIDGHTSV